MTAREEDDDDGWFGVFWAAWWTRLLLGLALTGAGVYIYTVLASREATGGTVRMPAVFAAIYSAIGKTGILVVFAVLGGACMLSAIISRMRRV
jgi:hypothetical protein